MFCNVSSRLHISNIKRDSRNHFSISKPIHKTRFKTNINTKTQQKQVSKPIPKPKPSRSCFKTNTNTKTQQKLFQNQYQYQYPRGVRFNTNIKTIPKVSKIFDSKIEMGSKSIGIAQVCTATAVCKLAGGALWTTGAAWSWRREFRENTIAVFPPQFTIHYRHFFV